jgi:predicted kinase
MPRLIVLNGPPGIGKSTLAQRYVEQHPLALALEQDVLRGLLGGWRTREVESGQLARELCLVMARAHLQGGHDVIVPQFVAIPDYLDRLGLLARDLGVAFFECVLLDDASSAERRFHSRLDDPSKAEHQRVAAELIAAAGGYPDQYERLMRGLAGRQAIALHSLEGDIDGTYQALMKALG